MSGWPATDWGSPLHQQLHTTSRAQSNQHNCPNRHNRNCACVRVCAHTCLHLIALGVEIQTGDSGVAGLSEANELLRSLPFKHPDAAVLSPRHIWCMFTYMPTLTHMQTERAKGTRGESLCIRNRIWRTWTTAAAFKLTLTILVDGMRCHSFHIIQIPFHNLKKNKTKYKCNYLFFFQDTTDSDRCNMTDLSINLWILVFWTVFAH